MGLVVEVPIVLGAQKMRKLILITFILSLSGCASILSGTFFNTEYQARLSALNGVKAIFMESGLGLKCAINESLPEPKVYYYKARHLVTACNGPAAGCYLRDINTILVDEDGDRLVILTHEYTHFYIDNSNLSNFCKSELIANLLTFKAIQELHIW